MQSQAPGTPAPPASAPQGGVNTATPAVASTPSPAVDMNTVRLRLNQLRTELSMAQDQQGQILRTMERAPAAAQPGLQQQLSMVQQQIVSLETQITTTQTQIAGAVNNHAETRAPDDYNYPVRVVNNGPDPGAIVAVVFFVVVLGPLSIAFARRIMRRGTPALPPAWNETPERLGRLEQAVDTVAIEIERISENQRFLTRVLAERERVAGALPDGGPGTR